MLFLTISLFFYALVNGQPTANANCIGYTSSLTYDLTALAGVLVSADTTNNDGWTYQVQCGTGDGCSSVGFCQEMGDNTKFCVGAFQSIVGGLPGGGDGVTINYAKGQENRFGNVQVKCNPTATGAPLNPTAVSANKLSDPYLVSFEHASGCGKPGGSGKISGGGVFLILLFVGFVVYFIAGVAYNAVKNGERGLGMIPQYEFWSQFPFLVVDGFKFIFHKLTALRGEY